MSDFFETHKNVNLIRIKPDYLALGRVYETH